MVIIGKMFNNCTNRKLYCLFSNTYECFKCLDHQFQKNPH